MMPVVSASLGALGPLLVKLSGLLAGEYGRLKGVRREIGSLQSELTSMHAALKEYTELEDPSGQVKAWISLVRELAYDIEDVFDKFIHRLGTDDHRGGFKEFLCKLTLALNTFGARREIANQIGDLKVRIRQVKDLKDCYKLNDAPSSTTGHAALDPRLHALFAEESHLQGVDGPRDELAKWTVEEGNNMTPNNHRRVLCIVGFGGLGKTTMANEVHRKIKGHFDFQAFVSVSRNPDIKKIIKDVINQVSCQDGFMKGTAEDWDERKYITKLRELLQYKRYLIIIDDIWSTQAWNNIQCAFPENNCSSRIIATTRILDVARSCCLGTDDRIYEMKTLSALHSRKLFFKRIFGSDDRCPDMLKEVSDKIMKKCGGLPLAIISISGLLANKLALKEEWEKVKGSIGSAIENNRNLEGMSSILSLSYNDLPPNLKTCLLYLSVFPEDYVIARKRLVRRWIAEGFISEERGQSQYEVAESYFYELISKSVVQPVGIGYDGKVRACRVHDMMLEVLVSKSAEDNFITVVGGGQTSLLNHHGIIRRLSIQHIDNKLATVLANEDLSHVRSLTVTAPDCIKHLPNLVAFEALRVLDFEGCQGLDKYEMNRMSKLFQLKYLGLKGTGLSELPSQIVMLCDLETLDFRNTLIQDLPTGFINLTKLQYLLAARQTKIPKGIGTMSNLQMISPFNATMSSDDALEELGNLTNLIELSVYLECRGSKCGEPDAYRRHEEKLFSSLHKLISSCKLRSLHIKRRGSHALEFLESWPPVPYALQVFRMTSSYYFRNIPEWIGPALTSLVSLDINIAELTEDGMHTLGELPALLYVILALDIGGDRITVPGDGFPSLKGFQITSPRGIYLTFAKGAMPRLEYFNMDLAVSVGRNSGYYLGIVHLQCLKIVLASVYSDGATSSETDAAVAAIKDEVDAHTNHPRIDINCYLRDE